MKNQLDDVFLPFTNIGRKYGYITWRKNHDKDVSSIFGKRDLINLQFSDELQKNKRIDWKRRRISITYTLTRSLSESVERIRLSRANSNNVLVSFE